MSNRSSKCKVGVIIPSFFESQFVNRSIPGEANVVFGVSGMGKLRSALTAMTMADRGCRAILLTGFAGGIKNLQKWDVVSVDRAYEGDYDARPFEEFYPHVIECGKIHLASSKNGSIVTQDHFLTKDEYAEIFKDDEVLATDMEAYAVVYAGYTTNTPVFVVKMISDLVNMESGNDFLSACSKMSDRLNEVISESISLIREKMSNEGGN